MRARGRDVDALVLNGLGDGVSIVGNVIIGLYW